jgi:hypothetical protein
MNDDVERIERYLRGVVVPQCGSDRHRQQLRRQIVGGIMGPQTIRIGRRDWKIAAAVAAVIAVAGLAGAVGMIVERKHCSMGLGPDGVYQLIGMDSKYAPALNVADINDAADAGRTAEDLAKIDLLRQQDAVKLVRVIESEVNGRPDSRTLVQRYTLPAGRTKTTGPSLQNNDKNIAMTSLTARDWKEIDQLRQAGKGESLGLQETKVEGRTFTFQRERYTLHDGTNVIVSVGEPKDGSPSHE